MRILGVRLQPYCLGHEWLLQRFDSPFAIREKALSPGVGDLRFALGICARTFEEACEWVESRSCAWALRVAAFGVRRSGVNAALQEGMLLFGAYLREGRRHPPCTSKTGGDALGAPLIGALLFSLMKEWGMSESEAMECPYRDAAWKHVIAAEWRTPLRIAEPMAPEKLQAAKDLAKKLHAQGPRSLVRN